ncbi:MAG: ROK family protein [Bacteroidales bacterium]|nr:ROK family protein [Bacteroidales bacterium]
MKRKVIFSLDAGGTNLVFSAIENGKPLPQIHSIPTGSKSLDEFISKLVKGFSGLQEKLNVQPSAISFCFPGPADYEAGIIGKLENLPFFTGGTPLAKMLEHHFLVPVFINNDGDLFALGEALGGLLPEINKHSEKQYKNLLGVTLGTGFGGGIVHKGSLFSGDNSAGGEINRSFNYLNPDQSVEEVLSIRGIQHMYAKVSGLDFSKVPEPRKIYELGMKQGAEGEKAREAWRQFGVVLGEMLANAVTLTDSCVVVGGGLSGAHQLFLPAAVERMNGSFVKADGSKLDRMETNAYNWEDEQCRKDFLKDDSIRLQVPNTNLTQAYYPKKKVAVGISKLGTSEAVAVGAYAFAAKKLGF